MTDKPEALTADNFLCNNPNCTVTAQIEHMKATITQLQSQADNARKAALEEAVTAIAGLGRWNKDISDAWNVVRALSTPPPSSTDRDKD